jgi:D-alanyl-D-alanine carboxypeptidase (penicillin-binding protein 5/6)
LGLVAFAVLAVAAAAAFVGVQLSKPESPPVAHSILIRSVAVAPRPVALPWPATGQGAVDLPALGVDVASGPENPVPVASLTKLMTAYVVLHDHPLSPAAPGPAITVTPTDVADYFLDDVGGASLATVQAGEVLTESQALGGLLVHSADNFADLLARWDAGTLPAFVNKMNAAATTLGMDHTHFADPSGLSVASRSTASDILRVAALDMQDPTVRALVAMPSVTLPVAGTLESFTPLLGVDGVVGVKSGFTNAAGVNDVVAVVRSIDGRSVLLLAAVLGQRGPVSTLPVVGQQGLALVNAMAPVIGATTVLHKGQSVAEVTSAGGSVEAVAAGSVSVLTSPGLKVTRRFVPDGRVSTTALRGSRIGTVEITLGTQHFAVPVELSQRVPRPTILQRIF